MKRTALLRKTHLKAHRRLNKISKNQVIELDRRRKLKAELIFDFGEKCMTCGDKKRDWRGISLSHIIPLSRGGKTTRKNCLLECYICHELYEKHPEKRLVEQEGFEGRK
jgi:5-methylcytosine-specific restriction endonuclease McrA